MNHEKTGILRRAKRYQAEIVTLVIRIFSAFCVVYTLLSVTGFISDSPLECDIRQTYSEDLYNAPSNISLQELELLKVKVTDDPSIADALVKTVRVLCIIMTTPANHIKKALHVKSTWGKRCNILVFMSTKKDKYLPTIKLPVIEGKNHLWGKTKAAFQYIYQHYRSEAEWFLKADDDEFVIVENLRYLLSDYNSSDPVYFGHPNPQGYMTGGAGYVLSREALHRFVNQAVPNPSICRQDDEGTEDIEMGKCLDNVRVTGVDTRDSMTQFYPFDPETHLIAKYDRNSWDTYRDLYARNVLSSDCCAKHAVSFHCLSPGEMYYLDYVLYSLRPYGIIQNYHLTHNISFEDNRK